MTALTMSTPGSSFQFKPLARWLLPVIAIAGCLLCFARMQNAAQDLPAGGNWREQTHYRGDYANGTFAAEQGPGPQSFSKVESLGEAQRIAVWFQTTRSAGRDEMKLETVRTWFHWDRAFLVLYALLFFGVWRALRGKLAGAAAAAGIAAAVFDLAEDVLCLRLAEGNYSLLDLARLQHCTFWKLAFSGLALLMTAAALWWKWKKPAAFAANVEQPKAVIRLKAKSRVAMDPPEISAASQTGSHPEAVPGKLDSTGSTGAGDGTGGGGPPPPPGDPFTWLADKWALLSRTIQFGVRARFSILGCVVLSVLLVLTDPGRDVVRCLFSGVAYIPDNSATSQWGQLGGFIFGITVLCAQSMGWTRLVLAQKLEGRFASSAHMKLIEANTQDRLRRDLPGIIGAYALLSAAAACLFCDRLMRKGSTAEAGWWFTVPLLLMLIPPVAAVLKADKSPARETWAKRMRDAKRFGWPLLTVAVILAVVRFHDRPAMGFGIVMAAAGVLVWFTQTSLPCLALVVLHAALCLYHHAWFALPVALLPAAFVIIGNSTARKFDGSAAFELEHTPGPVDLMRAAWAEWKEHFSRWDFWKAWAQSKAHEEKVWFLWATLSVFFHAGVFLTITLGTHTVSRFAGGGAVLVLGVASVISAGSVLVWFTQSLKLPVVSATLVWAVGCSWLMNNHYVRVAAPVAGAASPEARPHLDAAIKHWLERQEPKAKAAGMARVPCIVVAAEGGGIRAGYWASLVLSTLQDRSTKAGTKLDFASSTFAVSGVSGGSLGTAYFAALCAAPPSGEWRAAAEKLCGSDHLAPLLGRMMFADALQRFLPLPVFADRGAALEHSWEAAWEDAGLATPNPMSGGMLSLWSRDRDVPSIFLNGTDVDTGQRTILSNVSIDEHHFAAAIDAYTSLKDQCGQWDLPLSTAAHHSARFPYFNPPGTLPRGQRVVDGGLFENSGAATAMEIVHALKRQAGDKLNITVIFIEYTEPAKPNNLPLLTGHALNETLTPPLTLVRTRNARAGFHQKELEITEEQPAAPEGGGAVTIVRFKANPDNGEVPLSWTLSKDAADNLNADLNPAPDPARTRAGANEEAVGAVLRALTP